MATGTMVLVGVVFAVIVVAVLHDFRLRRRLAARRRQRERMAAELALNQALKIDMHRYEMPRVPLDVSGWQQRVTDDRARELRDRENRSEGPRLR
jgi:hypothetical protein